jgi:transposase
LPVIQGSRGATVLVGMPGFVVGAGEVVDGELWLGVETTADLVGCAGCGTRAVGHGRYKTLVRDLPISGRPTVLVWSKRRWRCPELACDVSTWSETSAEIGSRAVMTERARRRLADMVNVDGDSIASAAGFFGVGWHAANQAVADYTDPVICDEERLEGVAAIGVDEKRFLSATKDRRTVFTTQIVDLDRHRLLDVIPGRSKDVLDTWLTDRGDDWCARIRPATLDPAAGYRRAFKDRLANVTLVVDHFHAIRLANRAIDDVRRRVQQQTLGHRGRKGDPLYRIRPVLLTADERLSEDRFAGMQAMLTRGDPDGEVAAAWIAKELLRDVYRARDEAHVGDEFATYLPSAEQQRRGGIHGHGQIEEIRHRLFGLGDVHGPDVELATDHRHDLDAEQIRCGYLLAMQTLRVVDAVGPPIGNRWRNDRGVNGEHAQIRARRWRPRCSAGPCCGVRSGRGLRRWLGWRLLTPTSPPRTAGARCQVVVWRRVEQLTGLLLAVELDVA